MGIEMESMAIEMPEVEGHPNRVGFRGVLTMVDVASDRAPAGARGHRVMLTRKAAEAAIPSLLGMALDYAPSFDRHDMRRKVGVITRAEVVGRAIEIGGFLYARDFPEVVEEIAISGQASAISHQPSAIRARAGGASNAAAMRRESRVAGNPTHRKERDEWGVQPSPISRQRSAVRKGGRLDLASGRGQLGMSYEIAEAQIEDAKAQVWVLNKVTFTGAAILRRDKAAYQGTWIELGP